MLNNESQLVSILDEIENDTISSPLKKIETLENLIEVAKTNRWRSSLLQANIKRITLLVYTDNLAGAEKAWPQVHQLATQIGKQEDLIRLDLASLYFTYPFNGVETVKEKHKLLLQTAEDIESAQLLGDIYEALGTSNHLSYSPYDAIRYLQKAYEYYTISDDSISLGGVLSSLGSLYVDLGNYEMAIEYFSDSLQLAEETGNEFSRSVILFNIGEAHISNSEYELAKTSLLAARDISKNLNDDIGVAWAEASLADIAISLGEYNKAIAMFQAARQKFTETGDNLMYFNTLVGEVEAKLKIKNIPDAISLLEKAEAMLGNVNSSYSEQLFNSVMAEVMFESANYKQAYLALEKVIEERDRLDELEQQEQVQKFRIQFDSDLKESQNRTLAIENQYNLERLNQQREMQFLWAIILFLCAFVLLIVLWLLFKQVKHRNRFRDMALIDDLTQAPNRRAILTVAGRAFKRSLKDLEKTTVCLIDLDHFKQINDTLGHEVGDNVLVGFSKACDQSIRRHDHFGRYGGEEWLLLLRDVSATEIKNVFERIRKSVNEMEIKGLPEDYYLSFSMGCAEFDKSKDADIRALIKRADNMLYHAKQDGRDQFLIT
ncbi:hypothetical protein KUL10_24010 [Glaciecola sp. KUL10]|nr:hypothetical protein KUL10_24010 [Glaciecola sp. KUL10]